MKTLCKFSEMDFLWESPLIYYLMLNKINEWELVVAFFSLEYNFFWLAKSHKSSTNDCWGFLIIILFTQKSVYIFCMFAGMILGNILKYEGQESVWL